MEFEARDPEFASRVRASFHAQPCFRAEARVLRAGRPISVVRADVLAFGDSGRHAARKAQGTNVR